MAAGWQSLVRDACLTSVLGFHDLAGVALDRAVEAAPADVAAFLRTARADELASGRRRLEEADGAAVLQGTLLLQVDDPSFLGSGWQPPQRVELGPVRWTGPAREASINLPVVLPAGPRVDILAIGALSQAILGLGLEVNRRPVALTQSPHEHGVVFTGRCRRTTCRSVTSPGWSCGPSRPSRGASTIRTAPTTSSWAWPCHGCGSPRRPFSSSAISINRQATPSNVADPA